MWDRNDHGDQIKQSINSDPLHRKSWPSAPQRRCRIDANELTCRFHTNQYVTHMKFPTGCRHDPRVYPHKLYFLHGSRRWNTRRMMRFVVLRIVAWPARWFSILFPALFVVFVRLIPISSLWRNRLGEVGTWFGFLFSCRNDSFVIIGCVRNQLGALPDVYSTRENATDIKINLVLVQNRFERSEGKQICIHDTNGYVNICVSSAFMFEICEVKRSKAPILRRRKLSPFWPILSPSSNRNFFLHEFFENHWYLFQQKWILSRNYNFKKLRCIYIK